MGFGYILVISLVILYHCERGKGFDIKFIEADVNIWIKGSVSTENENVYRFTIPAAHTNDSFIRVEFSASPNSSLKCPIYFVVRQRDEVKPIALPESHEASNLSIYAGARTLCMKPDGWASSIFVSVSTCNLNNLNYSVKLSVQDGYIVKLDETKIVTKLSTTAPAFYRFGFPEDVDFVRILANSSANSTTFMSIQPPECPVREKLSTIKHSGQWQTMSERTSLVVQKQSYPKGFILLFLPDPRSNPDSRVIGASHIETISFKVVAPPTDTFNASLWAPMLIYVTVILLVYTIYSYCHHQYVGGGGNDQLTPNFLHCVCPTNVCDTRVRVDGFTADSNLYKYLKANSYRYIWTTLTIVFFYGLPVILLSLTLIRFSKATGDLDTCHFNYNCAYPLWIFVSFNHVYSCLGFVILGPTFMFLVHLRAKKLVVNEIKGEALREEEETRWSWSRFRRVNLTGTVYGAYQNFGTFYTLGFALMFVGVMKMAYNTCPNRDTTFFGLTFMFIIALLCQIKIYNLRHPCMVTDNFTFVSIGMVIGTVTSGYLVENQHFRIVVSVFISFWIQLTILILHSAGYAIDEDGRNSNPPPEGNELQNPVPATSGQDCFPTETAKLINTPTALFRNVFISCKISSLFFPEGKRRIFSTIFRLLLNVGVLAFIWLRMTENHFTTRMYTLVLANFLIDFLYYFVVLKCCHHEYYKVTSWQPILYLILAAVFWVTTLTYMAKSLGAWELPSILLQQHFYPCTLGIYDVLDMYHWTAAPAWFFTFMVILTADDPLSRNRTEMTVVF